MRRRVFACCSAASLLLCIAVIVLWVRGEWITGESLLIDRNTGGPRRTAWVVQGWSSGGGLRLVLWVTHDSRPIVPPAEVIFVRPSPDWTPFGRIGWHCAYCRYNAGLYPLEAFMRNQWMWRGFQWASQEGTSPGFSEHQHSLTLPAWFLTLVLAIAPAFSIRSLLWHRRAASGASRQQHPCRKCGYNLTGNTSGVCPECGAAMPERVSANPGDRVH